MPRVETLPGCWYLDALPSGEFAGILPLTKQVQTHQGLIPYPEDEPLWLVIAAGPPFRMAGQGHQRGTWEWTAIQGWIETAAPCGVWPLLYDRAGILRRAACAPPTGSQGWRYVAPDGTLVTGDATIAVRHGLNEWTDLSETQNGSLLVGQGHQGEGACVWIAGRLHLLHAGDCHVIRAKYSPTLDLYCLCFYEVTPDGLQGWIYWLTRDELEALPTVALAAVDFHFTHPVGVWPFKAEGSGLPDLFMLGSYTEAETLPAALPAGRVLCAHDAPTVWVPPQGLRPWDLPLIELYRDPAESLQTSEERWRRQALSLLAGWPGDCGVIPMMYDQQRWAIAEILDGLRFLSEIVNLSPQFKVIAPFSYNRANGIIKYPELQRALVDLAVAARAAGTPTLTPIGVPAPPPPPPPLHPKEPPVPTPPLPSLDTWIRVEFPQLLAAYQKTQGHLPEPDFEWAAFQTYRRFMEPEVWPFDKMLRHELGDDSPSQPANPQ